MYKLYKNIFIFAVAILFANLWVGHTFAADNNLFNIPFQENTISKNPVPVKTPLTKDFQNKIIRVLLSNKGTFEQKAISIDSDDEVFITSANQLVVNSTMPIKITLDGDYFIVNTQGVINKVLNTNKLIVTTKSAPIVLNGFVKAGKTALYKGFLEISLSKNGNINVINVIDIEDYIKGVVPNEMPVYFGLEALKAQAISARGYAYRDASYKTTGYDVCDTTGSQVYYGYVSYDPISNKAVDETMGQFALYNDKVILSLYSSTSGGHTESYENVFSLNGRDTRFPADPIPYLTGIPDGDYNIDLTKESNARKFYENKPESYETASPKYRWEYQWTKEELENILAKNFVKYSSSKFVQPSIKNVSDFGSIENIDVPKRGVSGKAMYVRIKTNKGTFLIAKEITIRQIFQYKNSWLPSANIVFEEIKEGRKVVGYKVIGGGFGHGVGLSQFGASGMAKKGYTYDKILKHYYKGISIGSYPVECNLKANKNCKSTFYSTGKHARLIIKYITKPSQLTFRINNEDLLLTADKFGAKEANIDIKNLIKKGINSVELMTHNNNMLDFSDGSIKFYVELAGADEK